VPLAGPGGARPPNAFGLSKMRLATTSLVFLCDRLKPFSANPSHYSHSFSFFRTNYMIPQTFTVTFNISAFTFQFFCFKIFSFRLRAVD